MLAPLLPRRGNDDDDYNRGNSDGREKLNVELLMRSFDAAAFAVVRGHRRATFLRVPGASAVPPSSGEADRRGVGVDAKTWYVENDALPLRTQAISSISA